MIQAIQKIFSPSIMQRALGQFGSVSVRDFLLYAAVGIGIVLLSTVVKKLLRKKVLMSDVLCGIVMAVYGSVILQLTLVSRQNGSRIGIELELFHGLLGPVNSYYWLMWAYAILNCFLFMPFGFVVSLFSPINERKPVVQFVSVLLLSFMVSMCIECTQLITQRGYYEVQDLFMNTLGGVIGWMIYICIYHIGMSIIRRYREVQ